MTEGGGERATSAAVARPRPSRARREVVRLLDAPDAWTADGPGRLVHAERGLVIDDADKLFSLRVATLGDEADRAPRWRTRARVWWAVRRAFDFDAARIATRRLVDVARPVPADGSFSLRLRPESAKVAPLAAAEAAADRARADTLAVARADLAQMRELSRVATTFSSHNASASARRMAATLGLAHPVAVSFSSRVHHPEAARVDVDVDPTSSRACHEIGLWPGLRECGPRFCFAVLAHAVAVCFMREQVANRPGGIAPWLATDRVAARMAAVAGLGPALLAATVSARGEVVASGTREELVLAHRLGCARAGIPEREAATLVE